MTDVQIQSADSTSASSFIPKLFEHERRIGAVEKDVERVTSNVDGLAKEVYGLPSLMRDLVDTRTTAIQKDATNRFDKLSEKIDDKTGKITWFLVASLGGLVVDVILHFVTH